MSIRGDHPDLEQLRRQATELLHAAKTNDRASVQRLSAVSVSAPLTLAGAQLAVARTGWTALHLPCASRFHLDPPATATATLPATVWPPPQAVRCPRAVDI
jgi:hypothetical protein